MKVYRLMCGEEVNIWVDLESIQMIGDVLVLPERCWYKSRNSSLHLQIALFSAQFAFRDSPQLFTLYDEGINELASNQSEEHKTESARIRAKIQSFKDAHAALIEAWKNQ
jgi:hypothetical protein